jgi:hypothetical protein
MVANTTSGRTRGYPPPHFDPIPLYTDRVEAAPGGTLPPYLYPIPRYTDRVEALQTLPRVHGLAP